MEEPFRAPATARAGPLIGSDPRLDVESHGLASGVTLVLLRGAVDADTARYLEECLAGPISRYATGPVQILLNMAGVTFMDRVGLEALLRAQEAVADAEGAIELLALSPSIVRLLHEAELDGESWMQPDNDGSLKRDRRGRTFRRMNPTADAPVPSARLLRPRPE